jgi:Leucine-rich repeat (LRR) protein
MRAALWLAEFDDEQLPASNTPEFRERYALAVFFFALNGRDWDRDIGFMSQTDVCTWGINDITNDDGTSFRIGVDCTCRHPQDEQCMWKDTKTVKRILMPSMNLEGEVPHEISLLYDLLELDLNSNKLTGEITQGILLLRSLRILSLYENRLQGNLPDWIVDMPELRELNLASNQLKGSFPQDISKLTNLLMLNVNENQLSGSLDPLKNLHQIEALFLGNNDFQGPLEREFVDWWPWLRILDLGDNMMGSTIPGNLFAHPTLHVVDLHGNGMSGIIPEIPSHSKVQFLALQDNTLGGSIPDSISNLSAMYHLDLSRNKLTGVIPDALASLQNLQYMFLSFNDFTEGNVPHYLGSMTSLKDLSLQNTRRIGHIPRTLETLSNLVLLDLGDNALSGSIPSSLGNLSQLRFLILYRNYLTGSIPSELKALNQLSKLIVYTNDITERADYMCLPELPQLSDFVMDCDNTLNPGGYPYCPCCKCCIDQDVDCDSLIWFGGFDPTWDTQFVRQHYKFHENDVPHTAVTDSSSP